MNPAGFLFGPNATVNVGGMVSFTSADYLRLADGIRDSMPFPIQADALLTAAPVAAFGFLGSNPGAITVQGSQLSVTPGQSISLVGGNITVQSGVPDEWYRSNRHSSLPPAGRSTCQRGFTPGEILSSQLAIGSEYQRAIVHCHGEYQLSQKERYWMSRLMRPGPCAFAAVS